MDREVTQVSKAELGQLRPPSEADIQQCIQTAAQAPTHKETHRASMAQIEKAPCSL